MLTKCARAACIGFILALLSMHSANAGDTSNPEVPGNRPLNEQVIRVPGEQPPAVTIEVTILHPDGPGPFPLAIMNHGATDASTGHRGERYRLTNAAFYFLARGYAVALPMMRGFASTDGEIYHFGCNLAATGIANARDIAAVIQYLGHDPRFDTSRVIVAGQSLGGWNTLALGSLNLPNVKGLINFNGGLRETDCNPGDNALITGAGQFGSRTEVPSIWFYGDNDKLFSSWVWRSMHEHYTRAGGHAELVDVGTVMTNSHNFLAYPEVLPLWTPRIDSFLAGLGMPYATIDPGYMPAVFPPSTQFAALIDIAAVPYLNDKSRDLYRQFLNEPFPRVFVITDAGGSGSANNGFDPLGRALAACQSPTFRCGVYAVDDRVVWKPFPNGPRELAYKISAKTDATTILDFAYRLNPDCSPKAFAKFTLVQPPQHGTVDIAQKSGLPHFPSNSPFAACNTVMTPGTAVSYTPARGFNGNDFIAFSEDGAAGSQTVFKMTVIVR